jgi:hypothetical protein
MRPANPRSTGSFHPETKDASLRKKYLGKRLRGASGDRLDQQGPEAPDLQRHGLMVRDLLKVTPKLIKGI